MHHPYLVCILFGMPSLHLFTFLFLLFCVITINYMQLHVTATTHSTVAALVKFDLAFRSPIRGRTVFFYVECPGDTLPNYFYCPPDTLPRDRLPQRSQESRRSYHCLTRRGVETISTLSGSVWLLVHALPLSRVSLQKWC